MCLICCIVCVHQIDEPEELPPEVQAARIAEYIASYVFKADDVTSTANFIAAATALQELRSKGTKTKEQIATSVLCKVANAVNKGVTLGAVYVSHLLFGHADAILSYKPQMINISAYLRARCAIAFRW